VIFIAKFILEESNIADLSNTKNPDTIALIWQYKLKLKLKPKAKFPIRKVTSVFKGTGHM
jgi:hypothetical protein